MRKPLLLVLAWLVSCGGQSSPADPSPGAGGAGGSGGSGSAGGSAPIDDGKAKLPCAVEQVLARNCHDCHGEKLQFGAPTPLLTYDDLNRPSVTEKGSQVYEVLLERIRSGSDPMPPPPRERLPFADIDTIDHWVNDGLPARPPGEVCSPAPPPKDDPPPTCEPTLRLKATSPWTMPQDVPDRYVCFGVDIEGTDHKRQITGIVPFVNNTTIVHHLLLFQTDTPEPTDPHPCKEIFPVNWKAIYAWGPGAPPYLLPKEAGFGVKEGEKTHMAIQVHYSNLTQLEGQQDATELGLCMTDTPRPYDADIMWVGGYDFSLPPHRASTVECTLPWSEGFTSFLPVHVFQSWPHMHRLGIKLESELKRPDGSLLALGKADPYTFQDQAVYPLSVDVYPGDKMITRCSWNNTTDSSVKWGEATSEEMCFNLLAYYPKINLPQYGSPAAAALSKCKMLP